MKVSEDNYYVYLVTNKTKTVIYTGLTNNLPQRITEHYINRGKPGTFAGKYNCHLLLYYESFKYINHAIEREKEIKNWPRKKKEELIAGCNPKWEILNGELFDKWPPEDLYHRKDL